MEVQNLRLLASALFSYGMDPCFLDLETGEITSRPDLGPEARYLPLPQYCSAHVRQLYMERMFAEGAIEDLCSLRAYPRFALGEPCSDLALEYLAEAHNLCESFNTETSADDVPGTVRAHETYADFQERFELGYARAWCEARGFSYVLRKAPRRPAIFEYSRAWCERRGIFRVFETRGRPATSVTAVVPIRIPFASRSRPRGL
ncbi:MAG: hypothetical protein GX647_12345 [Clostridiales bacterium]|jgi:hypothetical protein|nr:hypothetical protein [Clostridiales bacterium]OPZ66916.1 MAG: hypothetical protein BWY81_01586 [Firmicutes bacterium ADurb.Bin467]